MKKQQHTPKHKSSYAPKMILAFALHKAIPIFIGATIFVCKKAIEYSDYYFAGNTSDIGILDDQTCMGNDDSFF